MADETKPITAPSEQPAAPAVEPSQQGQVAESTAPVETAKPEPKPEPKQTEDPDAVLRKVREQTRRELESEFGKKQSAAIREANERAAAEHEVLLKELDQYAPDDVVAKARQTIQDRGLREQLSYYQQKEQQDAVMAQVREQAMRNLELVKEAGLEGPPDDLWKHVKDIVGDKPQDAFTFPERFAKLAAKKLREAQADAEKREKKAREEAERETEKRLGVSRVSGTTPSGTGGSTLEGLQRQLRDAHARNDSAAIDKLGREIEEAVYRH